MQSKKCVRTNLEKNQIKDQKSKIKTSSKNERRRSNIAHSQKGRQREM